MDNEITLSFIAKSENEALARMVMSSFIATIDPTIEELSEFKIGRASLGKECPV